MLGCVVAVSFLAMLAPVHPVSRYSLLYRDSKQNMGSSPASLPTTLFCFHSFFFILFHPLEDHKKIYFFFHFPVEQNKLIKIYFFIFSSFTHCKTSEKISSIQFFFPMCYSPSTQITQFIHNNSCYAHHSHIKHHACSVLILSRDRLGNHIPKL